jgi:hypothetical protein
MTKFKELTKQVRSLNARLKGVRSDNQSPTNNFYGGGLVEPTNPNLSAVTVTITSKEIQDKLTEGFGEDYDKTNQKIWDWLKMQSTNIKVEIGIVAKDGTRTEFNDAVFNTKTGILSGNSKSILLPHNPIDVIKSTVSGGSSNLITAAEKMIWEHINEHPEKFIRSTT